MIGGREELTHHILSLCIPIRIPVSIPTSTSTSLFNIPNTTRPPFSHLLVCPIAHRSALNSIHFHLFLSFSQFLQYVLGIRRVGTRSVNAIDIPQRSRLN
jgi:hypothetical protein